MIMKRFIMQDLLKWRDNPRRKPLLLTGVRQCGKTYILKEFGRQYFEDVAYFNFEEDETLTSVFDHNFDVDRILDELGSVVLGKTIVPGKTLVIFDEVQKSGRAVTALKYFCENKRELHLVAAGSLSGVALKRDEVSYPVGKVDELIMYPMTFDEYVIADGGERLLKGLEKVELKRELPALYTVPMEKHLRNYFIIGGMPEVVATWAETHSYEDAQAVQDNLLQGYERDFSQHAPLAEIPKIRQVWNSVPEQLARENNKFIFSHVRKGVRSKDLEDSLEWLIDAGLIYKQSLVEKPELPLSYMADSTYFKVFMADVGLLRRKSGIHYKTILNGDENYARFKGTLAENYVATQMISFGFPCYFWRSGNSAEVDFLTEYDGKIVPIEVKAADNTRAKSIRQYITRYHPKIAVKMSLKNVGDNEEGTSWVVSLPLYQVSRLADYISAV